MVLVSSIMALVTALVTAQAYPFHHAVCDHRVHTQLGTRPVLWAWNTEKKYRIQYGME